MILHDCRPSLGQFNKQKVMEALWAFQSHNFTWRVKLAILQCQQPQLVLELALAPERLGQPKCLRGQQLEASALLAPALVKSFQDPLLLVPERSSAALQLRPLQESLA